MWNQFRFHPDPNNKASAFAAAKAIRMGPLPSTEKLSIHRADEAPREIPRVLVVDDDRDMRELLEDMLDSLNISAHVVASAEEALKALEHAQPFDIMITDHQMPEMLGTELALSVTARYPTLPVVLMTAYRDDAVTRSEVTFFRMLDKPVSVCDLSETIYAAYKRA